MKALGKAIFFAALWERNHYRDVQECTELDGPQWIRLWCNRRWRERSRLC